MQLLANGRLPPSPREDEADSRRTPLQMVLGTVRQYGLDQLGRITTQIDYAGTTPINTIIDTYDRVSNRTARLINGVAYTWTYDNDYRLIGQQTAGGVATFAYDHVFNTTVQWLQDQAPQTMTVDAASRLLTSETGSQITTYSWDGCGNMTREQTGTAVNTYQYDGENRNTKISWSTGAITTNVYQGYDGLRRSTATTLTAATTAVWDGSDYLQERS